MDVFLQFMGLLFSSAVIAWASVYLAKEKNRNQILAGFMGFFFGTFALFVYLLLDKKELATPIESKEDNNKQVLND